jgi:hypothetical protein
MTSSDAFAIGGILFSGAMCTMGFLISGSPNASTGIEKWFSYLPAIMGSILVLFAVYLILLERGFFDRL